MIRAGVGCVAALAALLATATADAAPRFAVLPSPTSPVRRTPPFPAPPIGIGATEVRFPGRISSTQRVRVRVDPDGRVFGVVVVDRLLVSGTGDYSIAVPAPAVDAVAARGSQSEPGVRSGIILWQGFSAGRRVLSARITLRTDPAVAALPLRIVVRRGQRTELRLENATRTEVRTVVGATAAAAVGTELDRAYFAVANRLSFAPTSLRLTSARSVELAATVPLALRGTYRFGDTGRRRIRAILDERPLRLTGDGELHELDLSVRVPDPTAVLKPPAARTWRAVATGGGLGPNPVTFAAERLLRAALARQFQFFLANPDPSGTGRTDYRFVLAQRPHTADAAAPGGSGAPWLAVAVAVLVAVAGVGLVVAWAHA